MRSGFATEDLEGQMLGVSLCTGGISWWDRSERGLGDSGRLGLAELVAVDVACPPTANGMRPETIYSIFTELTGQRR